ncbi:amino acid adenylation domain-containing protein [Streptomyces sp. WMMB 714]|uniref:non-ribosomal peptide synthetase n=1 Tax=Streptomyces sp. WMMB 714 TaxID=1286822 RepID=UPI0005F8822E|nr:non-ribosomal peptide synthetase [Streptomyces sp. WMMB 714]SCK31495.1 amino acid adenylation domain-containing protein [Streptomyces sp. WMMB 714]
MAVGTTGDDRDGGGSGCTDDSTVLLPQLAEDVAETRLSRTYRRAGERVTAGEPLFECETDKVTVDVDAPVSGELTQWLAEEGDVVAVGAAVARVRPDAPSPAASPSSSAGTSSPSGTAEAPGTSPGGEGEPPTPPARAPLPSAASPSAEPAPPRAAGGDGGGEAERAGDGAAPAVRMAPLARKHARLLGLAPGELALIPRRGSLLTPSDIDRYLASARRDGPEEAGAVTEDAGPDAAETGGPAGPARGGFDDVPLSAAQLRLNQALERSRAEVTAGTVTVALDAPSLSRAADRLRTESGAGFVSDFQALARLAALTAREHPRLRARLVGRGTLRTFHRVTLGVAVATGDADLQVAGLPDADEDDFGTFARRWVAGLEEAGAGRSTVDGTATLLVSSLDDDGALQAAPVVVPPAVATLMLGAAHPGPDGTRLLTLAYDHAVLNGREAARFLDAVRQRVHDTAAETETETGGDAAGRHASGGRGPDRTHAERTGPDRTPAEREGAVPAAAGRKDADRQAGRAPGPSTLGALTSLVRDITGASPEPDRPLGEAGLTSRAAVQLVAAANEAFGVRLPDTAVWHHPTIRALAAAVEEAGGRPAPGSPTGTAPEADGPSSTGAGRRPAAPVPSPVGDAAPPVSGRDRAAVIGMSCSFPGAEGPDAFWDLLERGDCAVTDLPPERLAGPAPAPGTAGSVRHRAGLLAEPDAFDAEFFGVPLRQARSMDPQQRLLLELSHHALEDAGLVPDRLAGSRTGVFVGASSYDFREHTVAAGGADGYATLGTFPTFLANRISYHYDLTGPSVTVDTACSASLTALALAVAAIERGECETALVGGVNLLGNGFNQVAFQQAGMLSPQGLSRAFDAGADGYVRGEGAAWLVLKSHRSAVADGDPLLAVVRGATANHGGRASGPTAPNPRAQAALIRDGLARAELGGRDLGYVEAHGTGTPLGDPIEMEALRAALEPGGPDGGRAAGPGGVLRVGSVKANIGHLEAAAGLAGTVKVLLAMRHGTIPGTPHFTRLNPAIDLSGGFLAVADRAVPWVSPGTPRRAAVSSFGIGGANAHVVLEEAEAAAAAAYDSPGPWLLPLSAARPEALPLMARRLLDHLDRGADRGRPAVLAEWAWTLQTGRQTLPVRRMLTVRDRAGLREALRALAAGERHPAVAVPGEGAPAAPGHPALAAAGQWLADGNADWAAHWPEHERPPRRIPLPGHPFRRVRLAPPWEDGAPHASTRAVPTPAATAPPSVLVPRWVRAPLTSRQDGGDPPGTVLLVHDDSTRVQARAWAGHLAARHGARPGGGPHPHAPRVMVTGRDEPPPTTEDGPVRVLFLAGGAQWPLGDAGLGELHRWLAAMVRTARELDARGTPAALTLVTTGLAAPEAPAGPGAAQQGALLGALRALPHESPLLTVSAVDLPGPLPAAAPACDAVLAEPCGVRAPLVSLDAAGGGRRVECLVPSENAAGIGEAPGTGGGKEPGPGALWPGHSPVLIVFGGAGGVGGAVVRDLAARRAARMILVGRSAPDEPVREILRSVRDSGGSAHYVRGDMRREADVDAAFAQCLERYGTPHAVLHAAGAAHDALLHELTDDALDPRLDAKLAALGPLHRARARFPGTALVLFSSFLGTFGSQGGLGYAAANACLDRVAAALDGPGTPTRAVAWGLWRDTGLARRYSDPVLAGFPGLETFTAEDGCAALEECVRASHPFSLVLGGRPHALDAFQLKAVETASAQHAGGGPADASPDPDDQEVPGMPEERQAFASGARAAESHAAEAHAAEAHAADSRRPVTRAPEAGAAEPEAGAAELDAGAAEAGAAELEALEERIRTVVREVLPGDRPLPADVPWRELGLDSLLHVELTTALGRVFGPLPGTTLHEHGTINALAGRLVTDPGTATAQAGAPGMPPAVAAAADGGRPDGPASPPPPAPEHPVEAAPASAESGDGRVPERPDRSPADGTAGPARATTSAPERSAGRSGAAQQPVAVVGLAGRYPGAPGPDSFWRLLAEGRSAVREVPSDRWDWRVAHVLDPATTRFGCFLDDWDRFDAALFRIPPRDAAVLDPQERQFLQTAWEAFETAGYSRSCLSQRATGDRIGVYVGVTSHSNLLAQRDARLTGADNAEYGITAYSSIANRVSYAFDLNGPSLAVDTMCSSSLTAVHLACQALAAGDADVALAGGVHLFLHQDRFAALGSVGMTSPGPLNRAFGAGGDGFVPGEGAGAVVLKPLERAIADGDTVYAVITGSAVNHGGQGSGYTVPSPVAQADLVTRALERSGLRPRDIGYVEAHGTGTELGDPIEVRALARAFGGDPGAGPGSVRIGSVKSNIGHGEAVAGVAGLTKAVLQLWHGRLVPSLHARPENPRLELAGSPLRVQHEAEEWPSAPGGMPAVRRSAVSSFGAGGSNAHVVIEEFPVPAAASAPPTGPALLPLGAPDHERLALVAERLAAVLDAPGGTLTGDASLTDVAATLHTGRDDWPCRAAVVCDDPAGAAARAGVVAALRALAAGSSHPALVTDGGDGTPRGSSAAGGPADGSVAGRARAWVASGDRGGRQPEPGTFRRVALPTTPFAGSRHRAAGPPPGTVEAALLGARTTRALPLVEGAPENGTVRLSLPHGHPWVADHVVDGEPIAPGALALEAVLESLLAHAVNPYEAAVEDVTFLAPWRGPALAGSLSYEDGPPAGGRHPFAIGSGGTAVVRGTVETGGRRRTGTGAFDGLLAYAPERLSAVLADGAADSAEAFYRVLDAHGFSYGPGYRPVTAVSRSGGEVLARLVCDAPAGPAGRPVLHPAVLDGAFQAAGYAAMAPDGQEPTEWLRPLSVDRLVAHRPVTGPVYVHVRPAHGGTGSNVHLFDVRVLDEDGAAVADVDGFLLRAEPLARRGAAAVAAAAARPAPGAAAAAPVPSRAAAAALPGDSPTARHDALRERTAPYTLGWFPDRAAQAEPGRKVLLIGGAGPLSRALAHRADARLGWESVTPGDPEGTRARLDAALAELGPDAGVLLVPDEDGPLCSPETSATPQAAADAYDRLSGTAVLPLFAALRALVSGRRLDAGQVRLAVCARPEAGSAAQYALHGLVRTVAGETGRFGVGLVTADRAWCERAPGDAETAVRAELAHADPPAWVRLGAGGRERAGLVGAARADEPFALRPDGCYLIAGGTGGLGTAVAESVLRRAPGARLVVTGRGARAPRPGAGTANGSGPAPVTYLQCDVTDPRSVTALAAGLDARGLRLNGVVCVAGVLSDGFLRTKTAAAVDEVCRVKLLGATALDAALAGHPLDFFALASSVAVHVGNQGQSDYAFANGFLDGFAEDRASGVLGARPGRTLSVGWPALAGGGMRPPASTLDHLREAYGLEPLPVGEAAEELWRLLGCIPAHDGPAGGGPAHAVLAHGDLDRWASATGAVGGAPEPPEVRGHPEHPEPPAVAPGAGLLPPARPSGTAPLDAAVRWLTGQVHAVTGLPEDALSPDADLAELGVDSIALTRLARALEGSLGHMPRSTLYDHDTVADLARSLLGTHGPALAAVTAADAPAGDGPDAVPASAAPRAVPEPQDESAGWPVSERQIPLWTAEHAAAPYAPYNLSVAWRLAEDSTREAVAAALTALVARHPALGRRLAPREGALRLLPAVRGGAALPDGTLEVRAVTADGLFDAMREEAGRPLPLDTGPALRAVLWQEDGGRTVLQLSVHHLVADGRSVELIGRSLETLLQDPAASVAPSGSASFGRFLAEEEAAADGPARAEALRAWRERLRTVPPAPRFPGGNSSAHPWAAGHAEYHMPAALRDRLHAAASSAGVGDFTVQLAAYALAVASFTGRPSFLVSVPVYGRPGAEYDHAVGHFVNSVVVRVEPAEERPLRQWLTALQDQVRSALALADLPYPSAAELCREAGGDTAVPNLTFAYQNWPRPEGAERGPLGERVFIQGQGGHWDLGLELTDRPDGVEILANHRSTALTAAELDAFVDTWFTLAAALADGLDAPAGELTGPGALTLHGRFRRLAARHPHAEAVRDTSGARLTYAEADRYTAAVAHALHAAGVRPGEPVAVLVGRSCRLPVALLGVLRAGCPYVPLDASYPAERIRLILQDAGCALAVTERAEAGPLTGTGLRTVLLDELDELGELGELDGNGGPSADVPVPEDGAADASGGGAPAYLMFTSGSTGRPKGVQVSHRNVLHTLDAFRRLTGWSERDRLLAVTTASFDISVLELLLPLVSGGGRVVVADRDTVRDTSRLGRVLDDEGITVMQATPSGWQLLLDSGWKGRAGLTALCGGEALPHRLARELTARVGSLWNVYGPTEATIWSTAARLGPGEPVVLGEPVGATELLVTVPGGTGSPAAAATDGTGELWIGGPGVAHGYWRRPEQTADRFTPHPLEPGCGGRWFRTGDLVRRTPGGLHFVGRADTQVKIRGHRLELGEIEAVLGEHPDAARAVVLVQGEGAGACLVAVVVPKPGSAAPSARELGEFAARRLPEWMRPLRYVFRDDLPHTPNGKTDRNTLAAEVEAAKGPAGPSGPTGPAAGSGEAAASPPASSAVTRERDAAAGEDVREEIARAWRELLGVEEVPGDATFFAAGGNSMLLGTLFVRLTERFPDARLVLGDLFSHPTLDGQRELVSARLAGTAATRRPGTGRPDEGTAAGPEAPDVPEGGTVPDGGTAAPPPPPPRHPTHQLSPQQLRQARRRASRSAVTEAG